MVLFVLFTANSGCGFLYSQWEVPRSDDPVLCPEYGKYMTKFPTQIMTKNTRVSQTIRTGYFVILVWGYQHQRRKIFHFRQLFHSFSEALCFLLIQLFLFTNLHSPIYRNTQKQREKVTARL